MKLLLCINFLLVGLTLSCFAKNFEFRRFTIELKKEQQKPTIEQLIKALDTQKLGLYNTIKVSEKDGKLKYTDTKSIEYVSEYDKDYNVSKFESRDLGTTITGTVKVEGDYLETKFTYTHTQKTKDVIYDSKDDHIILMPVFEQIAGTSVFTLNAKDNQWHVLQQPSSDSSKQHYIALRVLP